MTIPIAVEEAAVRSRNSLKVTQLACGRAGIETPSSTLPGLTASLRGHPHGDGVPGVGEPRVAS